MTKSELITKLAAHYPQLAAKDAEAAVASLLDARPGIKGEIAIAVSCEDKAAP